MSRTSRCSFSPLTQLAQEKRRGARTGWGGDGGVRSAGVCEAARARKHTTYNYKVRFAAA